MGACPPKPLVSVQGHGDTGFLLQVQIRTRSCCLWIVCVSAFSPMHSHPGESSHVLVDKGRLTGERFCCLLGFCSEDLVFPSLKNSKNVTASEHRILVKGQAERLYDSSYTIVHQWQPRCFCSHRSHRSAGGLLSSLLGNLGLITIPAAQYQL